ncbi:MAG: single-stranded DNA-binding protein [Bacteroidota bacterium]|jgi:single-strand DNA-binding protein
MASLNKAMIIGRLGADPEVRYTQNNTAVANMNVATSERYKDNMGEWKERTEWHRVVAWGRTAEICNEYLRKGSLVYFEGPIQTRQWEDKDGNTRYTTEIKALRMQMLDSKSDNGSANQSKPAQQGAQQQQAGGKQAANSAVDLNETFEDIDDDLPF